MGGFNIGDIFGMLRLDNNQFNEALKASQEAIRIMAVDTSALANGSIKDLQRELLDAGVGVKGLQGFLGSLRAQGLDTADAFMELARTVELAQKKIRESTSNSLRNTPRAPASDDLTASQKAQREYVLSLAQTQKLLEEELLNYRAIIEAERIRTERLKEAYRVEQDMLALTARLRAEEDTGKKQQAAGNNVGAAQEAAYAARVLKEETDSRNDYAKLVNRLRAEEVAANATAQQRIVRDNLARQQEVQQQMVGDAAARIRMEQETERALAAQRAAAQRAEREQFIQHRRQMQIAAAATTIGTTIGAAGAVGIGAGLSVAKDAAEFQDAMATSLSKIGDISNHARDLLSQAARDTAKETGLAAKEIASDYAIMAKGGLTAAQSLQLIPQISKFAIATQSELHDSTKQVITIMEAMQLPFSEATSLLNKLTFANNVARGSVDQLATALEGKAGAALRSAKVSIEEALALTIAFSKAGVSAQQSQTFLTQIIEKLRSSATNYGNEIVTVGNKQMKFRDIVYLSDGTMRPFIETLKLLDTAFKGRSAAAIDTFFSDIHVGSARGSQALKILLGVTDQLDTFVNAIRNTGGQMNKSFDAEMKSPLKQLAVLKAQITDLAITIGIPTVAALQAMAKALSPVMALLHGVSSEFSQMPKPMQEMLVGSGLVSSAILLIGGSALVAYGHLIRLRADLLLLKGTEGLAGLTTVLGTTIAGFTAIAVTAGLAYAAIKKLNELSVPNPQGWFGKYGAMAQVGLNLATRSALGVLAPPQANPDSGKTKAAEDDVQKNSLDALRKNLEEMRKVIQEATNSGSFTINPEKEIKKDLNIDQLRQELVKFSDEYSRDVDKLSGEQQEVITAALNRINDMLTSGVDHRLIDKAIQSAQKDLSRFKGQIALDEKEETARLARENAANAVASFREKYLADLKAFTVDQRALIDNLISNLQTGLANGVSPKIIDSNLKSVELLYKTITDSIRDADLVQKELTESVKHYDAEVRKTQKAIPDILPAQQRIPFLITSSSAADLNRAEQIASAMKNLGVVSQEQLNLQAAAAKGLVGELVALGVTGFDAHAALVKMWEAEAVAAHVAVEQLGGDAKKYYRQYKDEVENSVVRANRKFQDSLREISSDLKRIAGDFSRGLFDLLFPEPKAATDKLAPVVTAFRDAFDKLSAYSDPKKALEDLISSIQHAGTVAQANAIAVKYFGDTAGPQLARDLRSGAISADDVSKAIDQASLSTIDYAAKTDTATTKASDLWRKLARDIEVSIVQHAIKAGIAELLNWMFKLNSNTLDLGRVLVQVWDKIKVAIKGASSAAEDAAASAGHYPTAGNAAPITATSEEELAAAVEADTASTNANTASENTNTAATTTNTGATVAAASASTASAATNVAAIRADAALRNATYSKVIYATDQDAQQTAENTKAEGTNTSAIEKLIQALMNNTVADNVNTTATNANTSALAVLTAAIGALIERLSNLNLGSGGGGGGDLFNFGGFGKLDPWGGVGYDPWGFLNNQDSNSFAVSSVARRLSPLASRSTTNNGGGIHISSMTVVSNDPDKFVKKLKSLRITSGLN